MRTFSNLKDLDNYIQTQISDCLTGECFDEIVKVEQEMIQQEVYDVYNPRRYRRRYHNRGLIDENNISISELKSNGNIVSMKVVNNTQRNGTLGDLDRVIEYGISKEEDAMPYAKPRPFTASTVDELIDRGTIEKLIKNRFK